MESNLQPEPHLYFTASSWGTLDGLCSPLSWPLAPSLTPAGNAGGGDETFESDRVAHKRLRFSQKLVWEKVVLTRALKLMLASGPKGLPDPSLWGGGTAGSSRWARRKRAGPESRRVSGWWSGHMKSTA